MPSPFPGMDPYIEAPEIWSDFHGDFAAEIRASLNARIQPSYVARLAPRVTYEGVEIARTRTVRPDVGVWRSTTSPGPALDSSSVAMRAPVESEVPMELPLTLFTVEILETDGMELVTAIEILSPVNKRRGHEAYASYHRKRRELLRSDVHLLEVDLLRGGERPPLEKPVPDAPYYVVLSRADRRPKAEVWPLQLREEVPPLPIPLAEGDSDAALDLGAVVAAVYERGAYARQIDYHRSPPLPAFSHEDGVWMNELLASKGLR